MSNSTMHPKKKVSKPDRSRMIAETAYYLAEQRGFSGGDPVQDWLDAEILVDHMAKNTKRKSEANNP